MASCEDEFDTPILSSSLYGALVTVGPGNRLHQAPGSRGTPSSSGLLLRPNYQGTPLSGFLWPKAVGVGMGGWRALKIIVYRRSWCPRVVESYTAPRNHPGISGLGQSYSAVENFPMTPKPAASPTCKDFTVASRGVVQRWSWVDGDSPNSQPLEGCVCACVCVCPTGGAQGSGSLGNPTSLLHSSRRTYREEGLCRKHPRLVWALLFSKDEGHANATPRQI